MVTQKDYALSVANKCGMIYGEVNYKNVVALLTCTGLNATPHPTGISIARFAAMVIQAKNEKENLR